MKPIVSAALMVLITAWSVGASPLEDLRNAVQAFRQGAYRSTIALTTRALASGQLSGRDTAGAYNLRGAAKRRLKKYPGAISDLTRAIGLSRCYTSAYNNRGVVWIFLRKHRRAEADFTTAINCRRGPVDPVAKAYNNRGVVYFSRGARSDVERAIKDFSRAISLRPKYAAAYRNRALAYQRLGHMYHAITVARPYYEKSSADWRRYLALQGRK
jgi:tetratricopeptide (TPR) repeat protein